MKNIFLIPVLYISCFLLFSCSNGNQNSNASGDAITGIDTKSLLPYSTGKINGLYVYVDNSLENTPLIDSVYYHLNQPYLITPNMSPAIDLNRYNFQTFETGGSRAANNLMIVNLKEESRLSNYVKAQLGEEQINQALNGQDMAMVRIKDVNATPQQVFYLLVNGFPNLSSEINQQKLEEYSHRIIEETTKVDNQRLVASFAEKRSHSIEDIVSEKFGISIWIPRTYEIVLNEDDFLWIIQETPELYSNIVFYKSDFDENYELGEQVIAIRDEFGEKITTNKENTRMTTHVDSQPAPIQKDMKINDKDVLETRGLWEMVNDKLGGGFVNYSFVENNQIITIDGFVFFSGDDKRRRMRDIDAILTTLQID